MNPALLLTLSSFLLLGFTTNLPLAFSQEKVHDFQGPGAIFTETPLDIAFVDKPKCATSSKWVAVVDDFPSKWLGIGGAQDHPGLKQIITGNFNIKKYDLGYKLVFCPPVLVLVLTLRGMMIRTGGVFY
ncbi:hypothetical protein GYH30_025155 [Glycine max]|uniref:Uncharacterized protein n=1 Tax=Glycine max TaxID=3847 RepID=K7LE45_SOYBN|nr:hypothetical protein GYH30_025155 [Glycine max]